MKFKKPPEDDDTGAGKSDADPTTPPPETPSDSSTGGETRIADQPGETRIADQPGETRIADQPGETRIARQPDTTQIADQPGGQTRIAQQPEHTHVSDQPALAPADEEVVEGEAVELPSEPAEQPAPAPTTVERPQPAPPTVERPQPAPPTVERPQPEPTYSPLAEQPVAVVTPGSEPPPVTKLGDSGQAYASGHAASPGAPWQEPVMKLANERPELVVAAAFVGGVLAAMILRRLGN